MRHAVRIQHSHLVTVSHAIALLVRRSEREAFNLDNQHRFEDALAAVTPRRTAALERMHLHKFQQERMRQDEIVAQVDTPPVAGAATNISCLTGSAHELCVCLYVHVLSRFLHTASCSTPLAGPSCSY